MKKYETYKDSGIEWVGKIPIEWEKTKFNRLVNFQEGPGLRTFQFTDFGTKVICVTNITEFGIDFSKFKKFISEEEYIEKYKHFTVLKGDYLLSSSGNSWGKVSEYIDDEKVILNTSTIRLNTKNESVFSRKLIPYILNSNSVKIQLELLMTGSCQPNFGPTHLDKIEMIFPPIKEQQQIVEFLDTKTSLIDSLIEKTQRKIEFLKEKRTSLINHVVTKGLNSNVELKESGVEWIGEIPSHYDIVKLKYVCSVTTGGKDTQDKIEDGLYPFYVRSPKIERINSYSYEGESVLTVGDGVGVGKVFHYVNGKFEFHQRVYKFSDFRRLTGKFFFWFIKHHFIFVTEDQNSKSTVDSLRRPLINEFPFVTPPISEQQQIVEYLDEKTNIIDTTIIKEQKRVELLKEYRQSLISEVVTGKIKVCD